ncbi:Protein BUD31 like protein [Plasmodiophora brassicae]|uniref:Protein BUD31 homolog n=1 Tax=Plasmodiophora brassicae TaxID=37360 RepID=A0A0G4J8H7_PLABS|nr:hypothetical protein PBRA_009509 [Plasmodiophora brassicae]
MPRIRTARTRVPDGFDVLEETLEELNQRMRDAETESHDGKRKNEALWPIFRITHERSRYIFDMWQDRKISREVYDFCLREKHADAALIAKWKKQGYERLCCLQCIQTRDHNFGTTCICRVPKESLPEDRTVECTHCGCRGCSN